MLHTFTFLTFYLHTYRTRCPTYSDPFTVVRSTLIVRFFWSVTLLRVADLEHGYLPLHLHTPFTHHLPGEFIPTLMTVPTHLSTYVTLSPPLPCYLTLPPTDDLLTFTVEYLLFLIVDVW